MKTTVRAALRPRLFALLLVAPLAGCSGDDAASPITTAAPQTSQPVSTATFATATTAAAGPTSSTAVATPTEVIEVADGKVAGGARRISAAKGSKVRFEVRADVADEIHVHGYEQMVDIAPGTPVTVTVQADIPGVFEVELENSGVLIAELEVR